MPCHGARKLVDPSKRDSHRGSLTFGFAMWGLGMPGAGRKLGRVKRRHGYAMHHAKGQETLAGV